MPRVGRDHLARQQHHIRSAAAACLAERGFAGTSMDTIIATAGVSSSTVYRYYPGGKQELVQAVLAERTAGLAAALDGILEQPDPPRASDAFAAALDALSRDDVGGDLPQTARLALNAWAELPRDSNAARLLQDRFSRLRTRIAAIAARLVEAYNLDLTPDEVAEITLRYTFGFLAESALAPTDPGQAARQLELLLTGTPHPQTGHRPTSH